MFQSSLCSDYCRAATNWSSDLFRPTRQLNFAGGKNVSFQCVLKRVEPEAILQVECGVDRVDLERVDVRLVWWHGAGVTLVDVQIGAADELGCVGVASLNELVG